MPDKEILMIHEMKEEYFSLDLQNYILTFDDGLYSQYYWRNRLQQIPTQKILFIISGRILTSRQNTLLEDCFKANIRWLNYNDNSNYMILDEVLEMLNLGFEVGAHSHFHDKIERNIFKKLGYKSSLVLKGKSFIDRDTNLMLEWFRDNIGFIPDKYAFPYNQKSDILVEYLKNVGFKYFYGSERINIEDLIN